MGWAGCFPKIFLSRLSLGAERSLCVSLSHSPWGPSAQAGWWELLPGVVSANAP